MIDLDKLEELAREAHEVEFIKNRPNDFPLNVGWVTPDVILELVQAVREAQFIIRRHIAHTLEGAQWLEKYGSEK